MIKRALILFMCLALPASVLAGGYGGRYHYGGHYQHRHHGGGDGTALLAGLLVGGLIGYFISEDRHYRRYAYPPRRYHHDPWYRDRYRHDYRHYGYRGGYYREYVPARPAPRRVVVREARRAGGQQCVMTREYTTTVEIDGQPRQAYGTRCMTRDGAWILGQPRLVPEFD
jgi:hypothetical protein